MQLGWKIEEFVELPNYYKLFYKASMDVAIEDMQKAAQIKIGGGKNGNC